MAIVDRLKWNAADDVYAWKYPSEELSTWTQLIVNESQEAILIKEGQMIGPFGPGRHTLDTKNYPYLSELFKLPFGKKTPFTAEVWFVNKAIPLDVKWGTSDPIQLQDPKYNIMVPVRAFGQYGVQIEDSRKFVTKLVGTMPEFNRQQMVSYFRSIMVQQAKTSISKEFIRNKISILEISAHLDEIAAGLQSSLATVLSEFGVKLIKFNISSINAPDDDPAIMRLKDALAKKAEMDIVGYNYQQERSFDTMETAAGNEGTANSGLMGAGIGMGMGLGVGGSMGSAMGQMGQQLDGMSSDQGKPCPKCQQMVGSNIKFCGKCGYQIDSSGVTNPTASSETFPCDKCGCEIIKGAKFCPNCSDPVFACPECGADNPEDAAECKSCNAPLPIACSSCEAIVSSKYKFCPECGGTIKSKPACISCNAEIQKDAKFCPECGSKQD